MLTDMKAERTVVKKNRGKPSRKKEKMKGERRLVSHWVPIIQDIMEVCHSPKNILQSLSPVFHRRESG